MCVGWVFFVVFGDFVVFYFYNLLLEWGYQGKSGFVSRVFS